MIVMKFGGSSVESAAAITRVAGIVQARVGRRPVVVVSAMGKTTNRLLEIAGLAKQNHIDDARQKAVELKAYHLTEAHQLVADATAVAAIIDRHFAELDAMIQAIALLRDFPPSLVDAVSGLGERLSSQIVALAFVKLGVPSAHVDSRDVIHTDDRHMQAAPLYPESYAKLKAVVAPLAETKVVVMGGFIASTLQGVPTTLGRGGSDFTASIVGAGIDAEEIQIWTDVDGMLTCDPRIVPGGHLIKTISFEEAAELAYFGAKVLHPATVLPAVEKNIPVLVLNSRRPEVQGTRIVSESVPCRNIIKSIACKPNITVMKIHSLRMLMAHGFLRRIFEIFDRFETPVDMLSTSEVSVSLTIDDARRIEELRTELEKFAEVEIEPQRALVCLVGDNIRGTAGVGVRIFRALQTVNVLMVSQGSSTLNFSFVIAAEDLKQAVQNLHAEFFADPDPEVFA